MNNTRPITITATAEEIYNLASFGKVSRSIGYQLMELVCLFCEAKGCEFCDTGWVKDAEVPNEL